MGTVFCDAHDVIFVVMDALVSVLVGEVPARNPVIAIRNVHTLDLSSSDQLMFSNQNTHTFRPNSIVAKMKGSKS